jgi:hypothetical protein
LPTAQYQRAAFCFVSGRDFSRATKASKQRSAFESNPCPGHESGGAPYLARFSRDAGYHGARPAVPGETKNVDRQQWHPTSREKRARYGAPSDSWPGQRLNSSGPGRILTSAPSPPMKRGVPSRSLPDRSTRTPGIEMCGPGWDILPAAERKNWSFVSQRARRNRGLPAWP